MLKNHRIYFPLKITGGPVAGSPVHFNLLLLFITVEKTAKHIT